LERAIVEALAGRDPDPAWTGESTARVQQQPGGLVFRGLG